MNHLLTRIRLQHSKRTRNLHDGGSNIREPGRHHMIIASFRKHLARRTFARSLPDRASLRVDLRLRRDRLREPEGIGAAGRTVHVRRLQQLPARGCVAVESAHVRRSVVPLRAGRVPCDLLGLARLARPFRPADVRHAARDDRGARERAGVHARRIRRRQRVALVAARSACNRRSTRQRRRRTQSRTWATRSPT